MNRTVVAFLLRVSLLVLLSTMTTASARGSATLVAHALIDQSASLRSVAAFPYLGASDVAYDGRFAYVVADDGIHVFNPRRRVPREIGLIKCNAYTDVQAIERGLIAVDSNRCLSEADGVTFIDTTNPRAPVVLGGVDPLTHTLTEVPGTRLVYVSSNGAISDGKFGQEIIIDATNPASPFEVADTPRYNGLGCHDIGFNAARNLAACAGGSELVLFDVTEPKSPALVSRTPAPEAYFVHTAVLSEDGNTVVLGDEAYLYSDCGNAPTGYGGISFYDVTDPGAPALLSHFGLPRGDIATSLTLPDLTGPWCSAHNFSFIPGTDLLAAGWYGGGFNVIDARDPSAPVEVAHFMAEGSFTWGVYPIAGRLWVTDWERGIEVFELDDSVLAGATARH